MGPMYYFGRTLGAQHYGPILYSSKQLKIANKMSRKSTKPDLNVRCPEGDGIRSNRRLRG